jgi:hypothetical protein
MRVKVLFDQTHAMIPSKKPMSNDDEDKDALGGD